MAIEDIFSGSNLKYIGGIALLIVIWVLYKFLSRNGGRLGEERLEEAETERLRKDEKTAEATEINEEKEIRKIRNIIDEMWVMSVNIDPNFVSRANNLKSMIDLMLKRLKGEKMGVKLALETFGILHRSINAFIEKLPRSAGIETLIEEINIHQQRYYEDLIKELKIDEDKKKQVASLWRQLQDQQEGRGYAAP